MLTGTVDAITSRPMTCGCTSMPSVRRPGQPGRPQLTAGPLVEREEGGRRDAEDLAPSDGDALGADGVAVRRRLPDDCPLSRSMSKTSPTWSSTKTECPTTMGEVGSPPLAVTFQAVVRRLRFCAVMGDPVAGASSTGRGPGRATTPRPCAPRGEPADAPRRTRRCSSWERTRGAGREGRGQGRKARRWRGNATQLVRCAVLPSHCPQSHTQVLVTCEHRRPPLRLDVSRAHDPCRIRGMAPRVRTSP